MNDRKPAQNADAVRHEIVERFTGLGQRKEAHCSCGWYGSGSTAAEREAVVVAHIDGSPSQSDGGLADA